MRVSPQDKLVFTEDAKLGEVEAREAYLNLIMDAEIVVDKAELARVAKIPEVAQSLQQVQAPERPEYKPQDWRAKQVVIRDIQWQQKPVIDYIAQVYKRDVIEAVSGALNLPEVWKNELFTDIKYRLEPQALQLSSPGKDRDWKSVFVQLELGLGSVPDGTGFLGKLASEFDAAEEAGQLQEAEGMTVFQSSLTGFDSVLKNLDPYAGAQISQTKVAGPSPYAAFRQEEESGRFKREKPEHELGKGGWDIADEPGYDKEIRSAFYDHFSDVVSGKVSKIDDAGRIYFTPTKHEEPEEEDIRPEPVPRSQREAAPETAPEVPEPTEESIEPHIQYISEMIDAGMPMSPGMMDPGMPGAAEPPLDPPDEPEAEMCEACQGKGCEDCDFTGAAIPLSPEDISDIRTQEKLDRYYGK